MNSNKYTTRIAIIGLSLIDRVYILKALPCAAGKHFASNYYESVGGIAANAALAANKLGADVRLISRIGADSNGQWLLDQLKDLDLSDIESMEDLDTASSTVLVENSGERLIVNYTHPQLLDDSISPMFSLTNDMQAVMSDLRWPDGALKGLQWARNHSRPGLLDYDQAPISNSIKLLEAASHVVFGEQALLEKTGCSLPIDAMANISKAYPDTHIAVTLGDQGVIWKAPDHSISHMKARKVTALDTLGAGDVFHGACTVALAENQSFEDALRFASDVASLKVTQSGGTKSLPNRNQLNDFIRNNPL